MIDQAVLIAGALRCPPDVAERTAALFKRRIVPRGTILFRQGDTCACCWLIVDGSASLRAIGLDGQLVQLTTYRPGNLAGAFPARRLQDAELVADDRMELLEAEAPSLAQMSLVEPGLGGRLAEIVARQHHELLARLASRMTLSANGRVYAELLALADEAGLITPAPVLAAVALRVNTTRETASRAVAAAERRGLLQRHTLGLRIVSRHRLKELVC